MNVDSLSSLRVRVIYNNINVIYKFTIITYSIVLKAPKTLDSCFLFFTTTTVLRGIMSKIKKDFNGGVEVTEKSLLKCGISKRFHSATLSEFEGAPIQKKQLIQYMKALPKFRARGTGLFITGEGVCGKSLVANVIAKSALAHGYSVRVLNLSILSCHRFYRDDEEYFGTDFRLDEATFKQVLNTDFLVIDDLYANAALLNYSKVTAFFDTVKYRVNQMLPTIISTRLPIQSPPAPKDEQGRKMYESKPSVESLFGDSIAASIQMNSITVELPHAAHVIEKIEERLSDPR